MKKQILQISFVTLIITCLTLLPHRELYAQMTKNRVGNFTELQARIEQVIKEQHIPGIVCSIVSNDDVIFSGGLGFSNVELNIKANGQQLFQLGSIAKMFTSLGVLSLINEGKLNLHDELKKIAPEVKFQNQWEDAHPIKIVNLLEHTTGFGDITINNTFNTTNEDLKGVKAVNIFQKALKSRWSPDEKIAYSNVDYMVLGYIIEKLSGSSWVDYVISRILLPIGMTNTNFKMRIPDANEYAKGYDYIAGSLKRVPNLVAQGNGADGSLNSCADDMTKFIKFFLHNWTVANKQVLPVSLLKEMETVHSTLAAKSGLQTGYGLGNLIDTRHPKLVFRGHGGGIVGFQSAFMYNRENGVGYFVCCNGGYSTTRIERLIRDFLTEKMPTPTLVTAVVNKQSLKQFEGYYQYKNDGFMGFKDRLVEGITLSQSGNNLLMKYFLAQTDTLIPTGGMTFRRSYESGARYVLGTDEKGESFLADGLGNFYIQKPQLPIIIHQLFVFLGIIACFLTTISGVFYVFMALLKKPQWKYVRVRCMPMLAVLSGAVGCKLLFGRNSDPLVFATVNATTISIFVTTLLFALLILYSLCLLYKDWKRIHKVSTKVFLSFNLVFITYLTVWLTINGMIGVRVWTW